MFERVNFKIMFSLHIRCVPKRGIVNACSILQSSSAYCSTSADQDSYDAIYARGFLKHQHSWNPPENVLQSLRNVVCNATKCQPADVENINFSEPALKFKILQQCAQMLGKRVPSSTLCDVNTFEDLVGIYNEKVSNVTGYTELARDVEKPKNLHIIEDPERFHPSDVDNPLHHGVSAFPRESTKMVNLRTRRLFAGHKAKSEWHHFEDTAFNYEDEISDAPWTQTNPETITKVHPSVILKKYQVTESEFDDDEFENDPRFK